jgi:wobble nucleotide-excising tRNase
MITKFKHIKNLAVFQNYVWDTSLRDDGNNIIVFKPINIFYGRNYSGKTTLSRIIRALETGKISDKYENPEFTISFDDITDVTQAILNNHGKKIRVFNEDFVRDNLKIFVNPDESITSFAILGDNTKLEDEIIELNSALGIKTETQESGFYLELKNAVEVAKTAKQNHQGENNKLDQQLSEKATNRQFGIKYKPEKFGDQNYTKPKLVEDIETILDLSFIPLTDNEQTNYLKLLEERTNLPIPSFTKTNINIKILQDEAEKLITKPIGDSDKIEQLVKNAILNRWVKDGKNLHKDKLDNCAFCGNKLTNERWLELDKHFDEESEQLEKDIDTLITNIDDVISKVQTSLQINKIHFYSKFHFKLDRLSSFHQQVSDSISDSLGLLKKYLVERKNDLINPKLFNAIKDNSKRLEWCFDIFENLQNKANSYSATLGDEQTNAKYLLRLKEINDFVNTIQYVSEINKISALKTISEDATLKKSEIEQKINQCLNLIQEKERLMNDEEAGALKVNEYLNNFFGHEFLTLQALEESNQIEGKKKIRFEIIRSGKKAHHLSEGECSLIAFCYFMAKLEDVYTKGSKPIIWIDDPISSLDGNHIFFIYSLINSEIVTKQNYEQLFISTHNLDFLKYLKRLPGALNTNQSKYFLVAREGNNSKIKQMPKYLKDYVTEFNFLFHQIYLCANANAEDDSQHSLYYNFANNTRKFLEAFLFYKYPNAVEKDDKLERFFGENKQASSMTDRINNEFSHLEGLFERSMVPIDIPEMKKSATFILNRIEEKDKDQYDALLKSIGVEAIV